MWKIWDGMVSVNSIKRKWTRLRLRPVRVFCFHHVSDVFEPETMWECDWMQTEVFKKRILTLKEKYTFISLEEAHAHIANDRFRVNNFAVLTSDDGWASLKNILPWLAEEKIPITLFLNPMYMDGKHFQSRDSEVFLTKEEVADLTERYEPFITIASHGWSHEDCLKMSMESFKDSVSKSEEYLTPMKGKVPFYAFTFGRHTTKQLEFLEQHSLVPVLIDGIVNYDDASCIHRECIDDGRIS
jgi:peptidoglycan/xylan/chitin deacetylase (PgdA/CDA1 family)